MCSYLLRFKGLLLNLCKIFQLEEIISFHFVTEIRVKFSLFVNYNILFFCYLTCIRYIFFYIHDLFS